MNKVITMIVMLGLTGGAYAAEDAVNALTAQVSEAVNLSVPVVVPPQPVLAEASQLQQEYTKIAELFQTGDLVPVGALVGGNVFGVRKADLLSMGKNGELKRGEVYLSVIGQDSGRYANAAPVYGIAAKLNSEFRYEADYVPGDYVVFNALKMNVSPSNKGVAGIAVHSVEYNGKKVLLARFTEKYLSHDGVQEYIGYSLLASK